MKTTTFTLSALAVLAGLAACNKENFNSSSSDPIEGNTVKVTLSANQDSNVTRAAIGNTGSDNKTTILWSENDALSVFDAANKNIEFSITSGIGTASGTFEGEVSKTSDRYVALYPYQSAASINTDRNTISGVTLKSTQTATAGSFDPEAALMTAVETTEGTLSFKNAVGYVKVTPTFACTKITLISNNSADALAGTVKISLASDGTPTASIASGASYSVSVEGSIAANTACYIAVLPCTLSSGFQLVLTDSDGTAYGKLTTKALTVKKNAIVDLGSVSTDNKISNSYSKAVYGQFMLASGLLVDGDVINKTATSLRSQAIGLVAYTFPSSPSVNYYSTLKTALAKKGVDKPHGLLLALKNATSSPVIWTTFSGLAANEQWYSSLADAYSKSSDGYTATQKMHSTLLTTFPKILLTKSLELYAPAFSAAYNYTQTAPESTTGWYLPSYGEWCDILSNFGGQFYTTSTYKTDTGNTVNTGKWQSVAVALLNASLEKAGKGNYDAFTCSEAVSKVHYSGYWTTTEIYYQNTAQAFDIIFYENFLSFSMAPKNTYSRHVRCVLAF